MRNMLVLVFSMCLAGVAGAGFMVIAPDSLLPGEQFDVTIRAVLTGGDCIQGGIYGNLDPLPTPDSPRLFCPGGDVCATLTWMPWPDPWGGDFGVCRLGPGVPDQPTPIEVVFRYEVPGDWAGRTVEFGVYDYAVSFDTPVTELHIPVVPEPATLALLALGAAVLRGRGRRR